MLILTQSFPHRRNNYSGNEPRTTNHEQNKKIRASLRKPGDQTYLRVPSIPSVAWQPYPSPLGRLRAHSFASPPHDGFAFIEDGANRLFSSSDEAANRLS